MRIGQKRRRANLVASLRCHSRRALCTCGPRDILGLHIPRKFMSESHNSKACQSLQASRACKTGVRVPQLGTYGAPSSSATLYSRTWLVGFMILV